MLLATTEIGIRDVILSPREVWQIIREQFYSDDSIVVHGATKKQIMGCSYRTRRNHFGREIFGRIEIEPLCDVKHSPGLKFFQFHFTYYEDEVLHRVIGWSHPLLMDRLKQRHCSLFVDATFRCVPTQFYQLVVVMMYDPISVRQIIKRDCRDQGILYSRESWKKFWKYFTNTWIKKFIPEWWTVNGLNEDIVNRTNNPLERYNRTLNDDFSVPHPDVVRFISVIEKQSRDNVRLINDISNRRARAPSHASPQRAPRFESDYQLEVESESDLADSDDLNSDDDSDISVSPEY
ncbi:Hypothetical protein PHPALM_14396 [Phytophthora palmivora]|uniref:Uncharacterized protein n=1 Tax=Phytophthora palmivora TaxID=4796 RepID=A0A2P4XUX1_9STRA|nr:Hypothetical protein PHPALM_14396 [Phytophthora palmivora]